MRMNGLVASGLLLLSSGALFPSSGAMAQDRPPVERRVDSLERQMRSVQRRVFQGNPPADAAADIPAPTAAPVANAAVADLNRRIDALERQLANVTGQVEETGNRIRTLEEESRRRRTEDDARFDRLEGASPRAPAATPSPSPSESPSQAEEPAPTPSADEPGPDALSATPAATERDPDSADPAENAYLAGFRLWEAKRYDEAESVLKTMVAQHPRHRRASWGRNLLGRTYLDTNKPATAAEAFLSNYQDMPQGDRAADSLFYLGAALMKLNKPQQACKVYDELADVYAGSMRDVLKTSLPAARKRAKCG